MNDLQRQLLADRIDAVIRSIEGYTEAIAKLERQLSVKKTNLAKLEDELSKLKEGVDW